MKTLSSIVYAIGDWFIRLACALDGHSWNVVTSDAVYCRVCDKWMSESDARAYTSELHPEGLADFDQMLEEYAEMVARSPREPYDLDH
jgi:hypothetical protein